MSLWLLIAIGWAAIAIVMALVWLWQRYSEDAGIVDVFWTLGVAGLTIFFAVETDGDLYRRRLISLLVAIWAIRLSYHITLRLVRLPEDGRYSAMRKKWGSKAQRNLFLFFQLQALASLLFAVPMLIAFRSNKTLGTLDLVGVLIWLIAISGETLADAQLTKFRSKPEHRDKVCRDGLWRYSRHPNYFFEWLHWWSYVSMGITAPWGWLIILSPILMLYFILFVTGIPPTEAQAIRSRGDAYRRYQQTTSAFFPWPPRINE